MSTTVDERVVQMRFRNDDFEKEANKTINTLNKLKTSSDMTGAGKGLESLSASLKNLGNNTSFTNISNGLETMKVQFSALQTISDAVWRRLTNGAIDAAKKMASVMNAPINQIIEGGKNRALNIEQAKFQLEGLGVAWASIEEDINYGVQDTAYGLDSAAKAAAQLVASQVQLGDEMKTALRGISGVAAMTNSEYDEIAHIFTTVAGNGRLMGMQLTQLSTKGFNAASTIAEYLGVTESEVRDMVSKGKIDFQTFSKAMDEAFGDHAKDANKTFTGALSNTKAALSRLGADFATTGFESLRQIMVETIPVLKSLKKQLKPIEDVFNNRFNHFVSIIVIGLKKINKMVSSSEFTEFIERIAKGLENSFKKIYISLKRFIDLNGIENVITGMVNIFVALGQRIKAIKDGFKDVFPKSFLDNAVELSIKFVAFTKNLRMSEDAQNGLRVVASKLAEVLKKVLGVVATVGGIFKDTISYIWEFANAILEYIGLPEAHKNPLSWITDTKTFQFIADKYPTAIKILGMGFEKLVGFANAFNNVLHDLLSGNGLNLSKIDVFGKIGDSLDYLKPKLVAFRALFKSVIDVIKTKPSDENIVSAIKRLFKDEKFQETIKPIKTLLDGVGFVLRKIIDLVKDFVVNFDKSDAILLSFLGSLGTVSMAVAYISKNVGTFIGAFRSLIFDFKNLTGTGVKINNVFNNINTTLKAMKISVSFDTLLKVAGSLLMLAVALRLLSQISVTDLVKGFGTIVALMLALNKFIDALSLSINKINTKAVGVILALAISVGILAAAVTKIANIDGFYAAIAGMIAVITMLGALVGAVILLSKFTKKLAKGASLLLVLSISVGILAASVTSLAKAANDGDMATGFRVLLGLITALTAACIALTKLAPEISRGAATILAFSISISLLTKSVTTLAKLDIGSLSVSLGAIIILMATMTMVMERLSKNVKKMAKVSFVLISFAISISILAKSVAMLGNMDITELAKGLGSIIILMVAMTAVIEHMAKNVDTLAKCGAVMLAFAIGIRILADSLSAIAEVASGGYLLESVLTLLVLMTSLVMVAQILEGVKISLKVAVAFVAIAGAITLLCVGLKLLAEGIDILSKADPSGVGKAIGVLIVSLAAFAGIAALVSKFAGPLALGGAALLVFGLGLTACIIPIVMITAAISGLIVILPTLIESLTEAVVAFVEFLETLSDNAERIGELAFEIAGQFISGIIKGLDEGITKIAKTLSNLVTKWIEAVKNGLGIASPSKKAIEIAGYFMQGIVIGIRNGIGNVVRVAGDIARGLIKGIKEKFGDIRNSAREMGSTFIQNFKRILDINSPSEVMRKIATFIVAGLTGGVEDGTSDVEDSTMSLKNAILNTFDGTDITPTITPVLNLSEIESGTNRINSLLSSGQYAYAATANISANGTNANQDVTRIENSYKELVGEMRNIRSDLNVLGNKVNNLKVYMNGNALVGEIAPAMDRALGTRSMQTTRSTGSRSSLIKKYR